MVRDDEIDVNYTLLRTCRIGLDETLSLIVTVKGLHTMNDTDFFV